MTTHANVREHLRAATAAGLGWKEFLVNWDTEPEQIDSDFAKLSFVSCVEEGEREAEKVLDGARVVIFTNQDFRAQVQVSIESVEAEHAHDLSEDLRTHFAHGTTRSELELLGVTIVQEPGPVRSATYEADGGAVSVAIFELPIRFTKRTEDRRARPKLATSVAYAGTAAGVALSDTVVKPA